MGININDVSRHLIDAIFKKGALIKSKRQHLAYSLSGKHLLYMNRRRSFISLRNYKRSSFKSFTMKDDKFDKKKKFLLSYDDIVRRRR
jgi:hypothetical protein